MLPLVGRGIASLAGRMISRNPRLGKNLLSLFNKKPKGIAVYRGEPWKPRSSLEDMAKWMYGPGKGGQHNNPLRFGATGRWFTKDPTGARLYAGLAEPGRIKKVILSPKELKIAEKLSKKLHDVEKARGYGVIVPKGALPRAKTDYLQTFITNFYKAIGKSGFKDGGLAQILNV
tara:strand:+ start:526 stop:1047 length:522 start_codon:yes stop_codon:yes gene_type:complete